MEKKKTGKKRKRRMKIVATASLPAVNRPNADRWNMNVFLTLNLIILVYKDVRGQMACRRKLTIEAKILHPYQFNLYISKGLSLVVRVGRGLIPCT